NFVALRGARDFGGKQAPRRLRRYNGGRALGESTMAKPRKTTDPNNGGGPVDARNGAAAMEPLGDQLLREAREGQADFAAGWNEFMKRLGVQGEPIGAKKLREILLREGSKPENNEFSRGIIEMREE